MGFKSFLRQNALPLQNKKIVISKRFSVDGKPEEWELRAIGERENSALKDACTTKSTGVGGRQIMNFDSARYAKELVTASVIYPDLKDAELQSSYSVVGETALLDAMLTAGEYATLQAVANQLSGFDAEKFEALKNEVKNS